MRLKIGVVLLLAICLTTEAFIPQRPQYYLDDKTSGIYGPDLDHNKMAGLFTTGGVKDLQKDATIRAGDNTEYLSFQTGQRTKRAAKVLGLAIMTGVRATKKLLNKATTLVSAGNYHVYEKAGGYRQALKDFESVDPTGVKEFWGKSRGKIGDRLITVQERGWRGQPTIDIYTNGDNIRMGHGKMDVTTIVYND